MAPEIVAFLARIETAPRLPDNPALIASAHGLIPFVDIELPIPSRLWDHRVHPSVWEEPRRRMPIGTLCTAQPHLAPKKLRALLTAPRLRDWERQPMIVIEHAGTHYLFDGNHRANAMLVLGCTRLQGVILPSRSAP